MFPPPLTPATVFLTTGYFGLTEEYFMGSHAVSEPAFTTETEQIRVEVEETLMNYGVNTSSVAMHLDTITGDVYATIDWRVDVQFVGDWMPAGQMSSFIVSLDSNVRALPGAAHSNSIWTEADPLTVVSVVGLY